MCEKEYSRHSHNPLNPKPGVVTDVADIVLRHRRWLLANSTLFDRRSAITRMRAITAVLCETAQPE